MSFTWGKLDLFLYQQLANFFILVFLLPHISDLSQASSMVLMHLGRARLAEGKGEAPSTH